MKKAFIKSGNAIVAKTTSVGKKDIRKSDNKEMVSFPVADLAK